MNIITTMTDSAATTSIPSPSTEPSPQQATTFAQLLYAGSPSSNPVNLSSQDMLSQQVNVAGMTVGVDLDAKVAGSVSQTINKLVSMA